MNVLNKTVISKYNEKIILIHITDDVMSGIYAFSSTNDYPVGTIINCRISKNVKNIGSSFLRYSEKTDGFINKEIKCESLLPLVLKKEPSNEKKALFSDKLYIEGDYCIVRENADNILVSSKIPVESAEQIKKAFKEQFENCGFEITVRTKTYSDNNGLNKALCEAKEYIDILQKARQDSSHRPQYTIFYKPENDLIKAVKEGIKKGTEEIVTDDPKIYDYLKCEIEKIECDFPVGIRLYNDTLLPLCKLYSFDAKISEVLSRKICLKSGAYITFDTTEALTAIDVNSAKKIDSKTDKETGILLTNTEACREIFRQIRLRNISGNILIDFINMEKSESYDALKNEINRCIKDDTINIKFYGFTKLKLAEISRQKKKNSFYQSYKG